MNDLELDHIVLFSAVDALSPIARLITEQGIASIAPGAEPLATLTFDQGLQGRSADLCPALPLVLRY